MSRAGGGKGHTRAHTHARARGACVYTHTRARYTHKRARTHTPIRSHAHTHTRAQWKSDVKWDGILYDGRWGVTFVCTERSWCTAVNKCAPKGQSEKRYLFQKKNKKKNENEKSFSQNAADLTGRKGDFT